MYSPTIAVFLSHEGHTSGRLSRVKESNEARKSHLPGLLQPPDPISENQRLQKGLNELLQHRYARQQRPDHLPTPGQSFQRLQIDFRGPEDIPEVAPVRREVGKRLVDT